MNLDISLDVLFTSAIVSAVVSTIVSYFFNKRLERFKAVVSVSKEVEGTLAQKRLEIYHQIAEIVYRLRGLARDIKSTLNIDDNLVQKFNEQKDMLIEFISKNVMLLDEDGVFSSLHAYKYNAIEFAEIVEELMFCLKRKQEDEISEANQKLAEQYDLIEQKFESVLSQLKAVRKPVLG